MQLRMDLGSLLLLAVLLGTWAGAPGQSGVGQTPVAGGRAVFDVTAYGAIRDGSAPATEAFARAIAAAKKAGGGTVYVPAGHYQSGPIELVSHLRLEFDAGAIVVFPAQMLPLTKGRQQGVETLTPVPLIGGHDLEDVQVVGSGTLVSNNADWMKLHGRIKPGAGNELGSANGDNWEKLLLAIEAHRQISDAEYTAAAEELRPSFVRFMNSKDVVVEGLHFEGSPMWTVHLLYTENAVVRNVVIETYPGVHTDGIVVDSSRFVHLTDDYIDTGDDGIVIKSGKDADGLRLNRPTEDVTITGCTVHHAHGAVTIGSETSGGVRNIVASNMTAVDTEAGIRIKSRRGRGGVVSDLRFSNWTMRNVGKAIEVTNFYMMEGETKEARVAMPKSATTPAFENIAIDGVTIDGAKQLIDVDGLPESPIDGLRISDVIGTGTLGAHLAHASGLELHNVQLNVQRGPAFLVEDCPEVELDHIASRHLGNGAPVVRMERSDGSIVRDSRTFAGVGNGVLLSVGSQQRGSVSTEGLIATAGKAVVYDDAK
jgi:polygalacturonase